MFIYISLVCVRITRQPQFNANFLFSCRHVAVVFLFCFFSCFCLPKNYLLMLFSTLIEYIHHRYKTIFSWDFASASLAFPIFISTSEFFSAIIIFTFHLFFYANFPNLHFPSIFCYTFSVASIFLKLFENQLQLVFHSSINFIFNGAQN